MVELAETGSRGRCNEIQRVVNQIGLVGFTIDVEFYFPEGEILVQKWRRVET